MSDEYDKLFQNSDIRHINPPIFNVIYDKPEGVPRGVYHE